MFWSHGGYWVRTKFCLDPCSGFRETRVYGQTDGRTTDDGPLGHDSSQVTKLNW